MEHTSQDASGASRPRRRRRWLLGVEPVFEGGWLHRGSRARDWDVEGKVVAVSILGDVTVDLAGARTLPPVVVIKTFAVGRDVEVIVPNDTHVELSGRPRNSHLPNDVPAVEKDRCAHVVRIKAHTGLGDVSVRLHQPPRT